MAERPVNLLPPHAVVLLPRLIEAHNQDPHRENASTYAEETA
jgi:hypothetical protein